jgi:hypothetical protein
MGVCRGRTPPVHTHFRDIFLRVRVRLEQTPIWRCSAWRQALEMTINSRMGVSLLQLAPMGLSR